MYSFKFYLKDEGKWVVTQDACYWGSSETTALLASLNTFEAFSETTANGRGFFAIIKKVGDEIWVGVDSVASKTIGVAVEDEIVHIGDDVSKIARSISRKTPDKNGELQFIHFGHTVGHRTLCKEIKIVCPGDVLRINSSGVVERRNFSPFLKEKAIEIDYHAALAAWENATESAVVRLVKYANGRRVVVPLSSGLDSRLVLLKLIENGHKNILCYTYGSSKTESSVEIPRQLCQQLNIPWIFIEYSQNKWKEWRRSGHLDSFFGYAHDLYTVPHIQDGPAIEEMLEKNILQRDDILCPGHSGDFLAGSHIRSEILERKEIRESFAKKTVWSMPYIVRDIRDLSIADRNKLITDVLQDANVSFPCSVEEFVNAFECFDFRNRQSKYIIRSVSLYESFGLDWWLPLWDIDVIRCSRQIPFKFRNKQWLYKNFVRNVEARVLNVTKDSRGLRVKNGGWIKRKVKSALFGSYVYLAYQRAVFLMRRKDFNPYENHPLQWHGIVDKHDFLMRRNVLGREHILSYLAERIMTNEFDIGLRLDRSSDIIKYLRFTHSGQKHSVKITS